MTTLPKHSRTFMNVRRYSVVHAHIVIIITVRIMSSPITVEIWSDIACPFCYIGKRHFEQALQRFDHTADVKIVWRSYQLDPDAEYVEGRNVHEALAEKKGWTLDYAMQAGAHVTSMAHQAGLNYDFDRAIPANTFDAHRLIHLAAKHGLQDAAEERLFSAYFTEGRNIGDRDTLVALGAELGLDAGEVGRMLDDGSLADEVRQDIVEASRIGVRGVPFFVFDRKYAVSGAQPNDVFLQTLQRTWDEAHPAAAIVDVSSVSGAVCTDEGCTTD